jgi:PKD repeat protein
VRYATAGIYTIRLTASNAAGASAPVTKTIIVTLTAPPAGWPTASFIASGTTGVAPFTVGLTDTSMGNPTSWAWDFGNGATSASQYPFVTYTTAGTYAVSLTATNAFGSSTVTLSVTVSEANGS